MDKKVPSRVQVKNRNAILAAALNVFASHGFRGATLDQIAAEANMSKPNMIYYFPSKEDIFINLLKRHMDQWLAPLRAIDPDGDPLEQILKYVQSKLQMSRDMPRESRLFANEIVQGAPRMKDNLSGDLKELFDQTSALFSRWMRAGKIAHVAPEHLIYSIWATTQHYADFDAQIAILSGAGVASDKASFNSAEQFLQNLYTKLLMP